MTSDRNGLLTGPVAPAVLRLAWPMLASAALQNLQSVIDLFWVGRLGPAVVAAVAMSGTILMLLYPMLMGLATGTTALVARATGARRPADAAQAIGQSFLLALALGGLAGWVGWHTAEPLLRRLGAAPEVIAPGGAYLRLSMLGSVAVFLLFTANAALQGAGDTLTPMRVMMLSNLINLALDPLLIFGPGPLPALGVRGAALATVLAESVAALVVLARLLGGRHALHVRAGHLRPDRALLARLLRIGIPGSGQMLSRSLMNAVMMAIVAGCGTTAVAAFGTGFRLHMIVLMPAFALGNAAATLTGQNLGAGQPARARRAAWVATGLDALVMLAATIVILPAAEPLIRLFNDDPAVIAAGATKR